MGDGEDVEVEIKKEKKLKNEKKEKRKQGEKEEESSNNNNNKNKIGAAASFSATTPIPAAPAAASNGNENAKKSKGKKKEKYEAEMIKIGVEVPATMYQRFSKDKKVTFNTATKDFIEHLETPAPGSLTGGQLPYTPMLTMRGFRRGLMNRMLACGPSKDPVLHRGLPAAKTNLPMAIPFLLDIAILLSIPVAPQMSTRDREVLHLLQIIARHHHCGYADEFECIVDEMTRMAEILEVRPDSTLRTIILTALMSKKNLSQRSQKLLFDTLCNEIEIDREQIISVVTALRSRDQLSRDQGIKIREDLSIALHDRRSNKIRASELIRKILKVKNG